MIRFFWRGIDSCGKVRYGFLSRQSEDSLKSYLIKKDIILLRSFPIKFFVKSKIILDNDLSNFFSSIAILLDCGHDLATSLQLLLNNRNNKNIKDFISFIILDLARGVSFASSLKRYFGDFHSVLIYMVRVGEMSGSLGRSCQQIANFLSNRVELKNRLKKIIVFPIFMLAVSFLIILSILFFVIPRFEQLFLDLDKPVPDATKLIFKISYFFRNYGLFLLIVFVLIFFVYKLFLLKKKVFRRFKEFIFLRLFFIKDFVLLINFISFFDSVVVLLKSGLSLPEALDISCHFFTNSFLRNKFKVMVEAIREGASFSNVINESGILNMPSDISAFILVGERSGNLGLMLEKLILFLKQDLQKKIDIFMIYFQPILVIFIGLIVLLIVVSVYLPIFNLISLV